MSLPTPASSPRSRAVLLDIEGTTTPISFVHRVLFPYAATQLDDFLAQHGAEPEVSAACRLILADRSPAESELGDREAVPAIVRRQMAADVKATGLKALQGLIWRHGYMSGALRSELYADVPPALTRFAAEGREVAIYSSGSRLAQQLIFRYSPFGDLTSKLCGYYDTEVGPKRAPESYRRIAAAWGQPAATIVFCSDIAAECEAAVSAGLQAVLLLRPGNPPLPPLLPYAIHADLSAI
jgi:enolase-phosphatase E1